VIIDLACAEPRTADLSRFTGRFANWYGIFDVALLGGRLFSLTPTVPDAITEAVPLEVIDEETLQIQRRSGFGSHGEPINFVFGSGWAGGSCPRRIRSDVRTAREACGARPDSLQTL
jgi:hypothetical protein